MPEAKTILIALGFTVLGTAVGWLYFQLMRNSLEGFDRGQFRFARFVAFTLARLALFMAGIVLAFQSGSWSVLGFALGFLVIRTVIVRRERAGIVGQARGPKEKDHG